MNHFYVDESAIYNLCIGNDGGVRIFLNGKPIFGDNTRLNPAKIDRHVVPAKLKKGKNTILIAFDTANGSGWGFYFRFAAPKGKSKLALPGVIR